MRANFVGRRSSVPISFIEMFVHNNNNNIAIAQDVQRIIEVGDSMGLHLNIVKCELISSPDFQVSDATLKSFPRTSIADASLLGAPLFPGVVLDEA